MCAKYGEKWIRNKRITGKKISGKKQTQTNQYFVQ